MPVVERTERKGHTPDSVGGAEDDGGTRKQMANSSTVGDASSLWDMKRNLMMEQKGKTFSKV